MKFYVTKAPRLLQWIFPHRVWVLSRKSPAVYLTFDDGPVPEVTPWVLDLLKEYKAKATFFCIGENIEKHPDIFHRMITEGHTVANHTYHHLNGWKTPASEYLANVLQCEELIPSEDNNKSPKLFRPPYGKITSRQAKILQKKGFTIVMWDIISYDFDATLSEEKCLHNVLKHIQPGSIIVFHDSVKAQKNLRYVLPKVLEFIEEKKIVCKLLKSSLSNI